MDSLFAAFSELLKRYEIETTPQELKAFLQEKGYDVSDATDDLLWNALTDYDNDISVTEMGYYGSWPPHNNSIIKFRYQNPDQPYLEKDGEQIPNMIDHFCLVVDSGNNMILDSLDGEVKQPGHYGLPLSWATYSKGGDQDFILPDAEEAKSVKLHIVLKNDNIWEVAQRYGTTVEELLAHNALDKAEDIKEGMILHLPISKNLPDTREVSYTILPQAASMHVAPDNGARKFSFSGATTWTDILPTGPTYPKNANVEIVAMAHVPIGADETAVYLMDRLALGNFEQNGKPDYTIGFNHSQLENGYTVISKKILINHPEDNPSPGIAELPTTQLDYSEPTNVIPSYKTTYVPYEIPQKFVASEAIWVLEVDGHRPDKFLEHGQEVTVGGSFIMDNEIYLRPLASIKNGLWYGIPLRHMIPEQELYNTDIPLVEKVAMPKGKLSYSERGVVSLAKMLSRADKLKVYLNKNKQGEK